MSDESRVVLIRVQRPGQFAPIQKKYIRRRAGRVFEGEALYRIGTADAPGHITEEILKAVKADPSFLVQDPYVAPKPGTPSKVLAPFQARAKAIAAKIARGDVKIAPVPEWQKPTPPPEPQKAPPRPVPPRPEKPKGKKD